MIEESTLGPASARQCRFASRFWALISLLDHDDYWPQGRNEGLLTALAADPAAMAAYGRLRVLVEPGCDDQGMAALDGRFAPSVGLHAYVFLRSLIDRAGAMDETMLLGEDTDYITRLKQAGMRSAVYDGDAAVYRRHAGNITFDTVAKRNGLFAVMSSNLKRRRASDG